MFFNKSFENFLFSPIKLKFHIGHIYDFNLENKKKKKVKIRVKRQKDCNFNHIIDEININSSKCIKSLLEKLTNEN